MGVAINLDEMAAAFVQTGAAGRDWAEPLALAEVAFAARGVILMNYGPGAGDAPRVEIAASPGMPAQTENYQRDFAAIDHRAAFCFASPPGRLLHDEMIAPIPVRARMPIYAEFLDPLDIGRFCAVNLGPIGAADGAATFLSLSFANDAPALSPADGRTLLKLAQFARAAVRAASVVRAFRAPEGLLRQALEQRPIAAFMMSREGVLVDLNAAAASLARAGEFLSLTKGRLGFFDAHAQQRLELARLADWRLYASHTWRARGRTGRDITIVALNGLGRDLGLAGDAMLVLALGAPRPVIGNASAGLWRERLGLDDAQCRLAQGLAAGADPLELALLGGLTPEAFDGRLNALCAHLGVSSPEAARALLASVVRPN